VSVQPDRNDGRLRCRGTPAQDGCGVRDHLQFFWIQLFKEPFGAEVKRAPRLMIGSRALGSVVETPAGGTARDRAAQITQEVGRGRLPPFVPPAERLLVVYRDRPLQSFRQGEAGAGLSFGLRR